MLIVGLTGGIASGKSSASRFFAELGIDVIDADKIARDLFKPNSPHLTSLKEHFGEDIFAKNGELDRKKLGGIVFSDPKQLEWLNNLTHPLVNGEIHRKIAKATSLYIILDVPLLINRDGAVPLHFSSIIQRVLVIDVPEELQIQRIKARDNITKEDAKKIIDSQSTRQQRIAVADHVILNTDSLEALEQQVHEVHNGYLELAKAFH